MDQFPKTRKHSEKSKLTDNEEKDQISSLPDEILCHMLSFMPTKYAVRTSILSTRWKSLWTSVPSIDLFSFPGADKHARNGFMDFVDRILLFHNLQTINKFHICCGLGYYRRHRLNSWICTALKLNVKELVINFRIGLVVELPRNLFTSANLVVLKLLGDIFFRFPMPVFLPNVKVLHLESLILNEDSFKNLLSGCPILEELDIKRFNRDCIKTLCICSSTLKRIYIDDRFHRERNSQYGIVIKTPALEILEFRGDVLKNFYVDELPYLVRAHFRVSFQGYDSETSDFYDSGVVEMLGKISKIQNLRLSCSILKAVIQASANNIVLLFHNLTHFHVDMEAIQLSILPDLLRHVPNLNILRFNKDCNKPCSWDVVPESVPECLLLCLETIEFSGFCGCEEEMKLISYLLVNSKVLKKFILIKSWTKDKKIKTNIRSLPRGSSACQIEFCYPNIRSLPRSFCLCSSLLG